MADTRIHAASRHETRVDDREWTDAAGFAVLLTFTLETEYSDAWDGPDHTIDPLLAEVWPCIARPMGHSFYSGDALRDAALEAWLKAHHDELVELAMDEAQRQCELHDERRAER